MQFRLRPAQRFELSLCGSELIAGLLQLSVRDAAFVQQRSLANRSSALRDGKCLPDLQQLLP